MFSGARASTLSSGKYIIISNLNFKIMSYFWLENYIKCLDCCRNKFETGSFYNPYVRLTNNQTLLLLQEIFLSRRQKIFFFYIAC